MHIVSVRLRGPTRVDACSAVMYASVFVRELSTFGALLIGVQSH